MHIANDLVIVANHNIIYAGPLYEVTEISLIPNMTNGTVADDNESFAQSSYIHRHIIISVSASLFLIIAGAGVLVMIVICIYQARKRRQAVCRNLERQYETVDEPVYEMILSNNILLECLNKMPRTGPRKTSSKPGAMCDLCCDALEKDQDVLKCEGECGCTVHRYCAGVTKRQYASFNDGNSPFVCQWCSMKTAGVIIQQLQSQVASLQAELAKTKEELAKQREQPQPSTYASAVVSTNMTANHPSNSARRRRQPQGQQRRSRRTQPTVSICTSAQPTRESSDSVTTDSSSSANRNDMQERVEVDGARKVWGTHPHATSKTVENAIVRFCQIQGLRVRRKTSTNEGNCKRRKRKMETESGNGKRKRKAETGMGRHCNTYNVTV